MKKTVFVSLFFYFNLFSPLFCQQKKVSDHLFNLTIDSLKTLNEQSKNSNPEIAITYVEALLKKGLNNNHLENIAYGYSQLGSIHQIMGNYQNSLSYYNKSIHIAKKSKNNPKLAVLYKEKGNTFYYLNDFKNALVNYRKCIKLAKTSKNKEQEILGYLNIALIKKKIGQYEEALKIERENIARAANVNFKNPITRINLFLNLSGTYLNLKKNDSAIYYSEVGLKESLKIKDIEGVSYFYNTLGIAYYHNENYKQALSYFFYALSLVKTLQNKKRITSTHFLIGKTYLATSNYNKAIFHLNRAESVISDIPNFYSEDLEETYKLLAQIYSSKNEYKKSKIYFEKYTLLDSLSDSNKTEIISDLYYSDLNKKKRILEKLSKEKKGFKYLIGLICFIIVILIISLIIYIKRWNINKKRIQELLLKVENSKIIPNKRIIKITDQKAKKIFKKLKETEIKEYYLKPSFSLNSLAKKLKTNPTYLSKIINEYEEKKFTEYTNELRINYALKRLKEDPRFRSYSILHIAKELGYKSPDSFSRHFKKQTGIYPSFYISSINKN